MSRSRTLAQIEGKAAAKAGTPHAANPYGPDQFGESLSWSHAWLLERVQSETGLFLVPTAPALGADLNSPAS